jgi:hypothetical protein
LLLILVPWSPFWERNYFADMVPLLRDVVANNFVRGAVSGLGVVNMIAGLSDLASVMASRRMANAAGASAADAIGSGLANEEWPSRGAR